MAGSYVRVMQPSLKQKLNPIGLRVDKNSVDLFYRLEPRRQELVLPTAQFSQSPPW
jgi:hypothetical protein